MPLPSIASLRHTFALPADAALAAARAEIWPALVAAASEPNSLAAAVDDVYAACGQSDDDSDVVRCVECLAAGIVVREIADPEAVLDEIAEAVQQQTLSTEYLQSARRGAVVALASARRPLSDASLRRACDVTPTHASFRPQLTIFEQNAVGALATVDPRDTPAVRELFAHPFPAVWRLRIDAGRAFDSLERMLVVAQLEAGLDSRVGKSVIDTVCDAVVGGEGAAVAALLLANVTTRFYGKALERDAKEVQVCRALSKFYSHASASALPAPDVATRHRMDHRIGIALVRAWRDEIRLLAHADLVTALEAHTTESNRRSSPNTIAGIELLEQLRRRLERCESRAQHLLEITRFYASTHVNFATRGANRALTNAIGGHVLEHARTVERAVAFADDTNALLRVAVDAATDYLVDDDGAPWEVEMAMLGFLFAARPQRVCDARQQMLLFERLTRLLDEPHGAAEFPVGLMAAAFPRAMRVALEMGLQVPMRPQMQADGLFALACSAVASNGDSLLVVADRIFCYTGGAADDVVRLLTAFLQVLDGLKHETTLAENASEINALWLMVSGDFFASAGTEDVRSRSLDDARAAGVAAVGSIRAAFTAPPPTSIQVVSKKERRRVRRALERSAKPPSPTPPPQVEMETAGDDDGDNVCAPCTINLTSAWDRVARNGDSVATTPPRSPVEIRRFEVCYDGPKCNAPNCRRHHPGQTRSIPPICAGVKACKGYRKCSFLHLSGSTWSEFDTFDAAAAAAYAEELDVERAIRLSNAAAAAPPPPPAPPPAPPPPAPPPPAPPPPPPPTTLASECAVCLEEMSTRSVFSCGCARACPSCSKVAAVSGRCPFCGMEAAIVVERIHV